MYVLQSKDGYQCLNAMSVPPSALQATVIKAITFVLTIVVQQVQRAKGVQTSAVPFIFWFLQMICEAVAMYTRAIKKSWCAEDMVFAVYFGLVILQLILHCFAEHHRAAPQGANDKYPCPEEKASILSRVLYIWIQPVIWSVYKKTFNPDTFWDQTPKLKCDLIGPRLEKAWLEEKDRCNTKNRKRQTKSHMDESYDIETTFSGRTGERIPLLDGNEDDNLMRPSLMRAMAGAFLLDWLEAVFYRGVAEVLWLLEPFALRYIIDIAENKDSYPAWQGFFFCVMLFITLCISSCFYHLSYHHMQAFGLRLKSSLICLIYKKALTMKRSTGQATTVGEIVNHMSVDCQRVQDAVTFSYYIIIGFVTIGMALIQLWPLVGVASVGGVAVIFALIPVLGIVSAKQTKLQRHLLKLKGERVKIISEVINGIKVLKMYAWESSFMGKIRAIRLEEIKCLWTFGVLTAINVSVSVHSTFVILFVVVLIRVLVSPTHSLRADETFTSISVINIMKFPLTMVPFILTSGIQAMISVRRIEKFLLSDDIQNNSVRFVQSIDGFKPALEITRGRFSWGEDQDSVLRNINVRIGESELVAVVGPVGCGKSSFISACLGEMNREEGSVTVKGNIAYVPQEAWIQNMTLRDNILFGKKYQERKYKKVIQSCALERDLEILSGGDLTEIGEKGINISGGQKQRVSLARAVYNNADVYFLDDPLSAVDSHVGKHLFEKVVGRNGILKNKTRILVTHGIHWLPFVDRILVLSRGGISETGTYEELIGQNGAFAEFLDQYRQENTHESDEDEDPEVVAMRRKIFQQVEEMRSDGGMTSEDDVTSTTRRRRKSRQTNFSASATQSKTVNTFSAAHGDLTRLTLEESSEEGSVNPKVLIRYLRAMGIPSVVCVLLSMTLYQGLNVFSNFWLTFWTEDPVLLNITLAGTSQYEQTFTYYLVLFTVYGILQGILVYISFYVAMTRMARASQRLHESMLHSVLRSPMSFFDTTPVGRIMNRFASDIDIIDNKLPDSFRLWQIMIFSSIATVFVIVISTPIMLAVLVPVSIIYVFFLKFYLPTARAMRRTESVRRSPIYNHFSETITGASVIRAYRCSDRFVQESRRRVDDNTKYYYAANTGTRWMGWRVEFLGNLLSFLAAIFALTLNDLNGAQVGLSITYAVQLVITLNFGVFAISEMEMNVISAERVTEYTSLPSEADWEGSSDNRVSSDWPEKGVIDFRNYSTRYREGLDLVLKGLSCHIYGGEKVGIVGRTGAGKSSLALSLFRLIEGAGGSIVIDGINIADLGLHQLRGKLTILPQDPVLFSGSLRVNLDPFSHYDDNAIWQAIDRAHLKEFVAATGEGLNYDVGEGGQNLSVGQRQLVCLARTLLHKTRVLILDEATAAVDMETDQLIQDTIRQHFTECTILTVAHRLNTIMDYDRVMVMDAGAISEFDAPQKLLTATNSVFYGMAKDAGLV
ncbi:multidrug resistance-associated protein 1-like [Mya arenaria]|uniref:multidrug resistance-associated protein 1-like n=1 Tax=Mya arenaria TaxID=6604 RepID=UPI0022E51470|nr:multidrug resistance-associated protein 1-like [Mya arenaria]